MIGTLAYVTMKKKYIRMQKSTWKWVILIAIYLAIFPSFAQRITLDKQKTYQTIHSFGASDCWSMAMVGRYYPEAKKQLFPGLMKMNTRLPLNTRHNL